MAAATTITFGGRPTGRSGRSDEYGFGADARELQAFFCGYEASVGFGSTYHAMISAWAGVRHGSGPPASWDPYAAIVHKISEGMSVFRALKLLDEGGHTEDVVVLFKLYGPRSPHERVEFGDLAPLAIYTQAAADARDQIAARLGTVREEGLGDRVERDHATVRRELERDFWREAGRIARLLEQHGKWVDRLDALQSRENAGAELGPRCVGWLADGHRRLAELEARIRASEQLQGQILDAYLYDGRLRARLGALAGADREVTVEDAIRARLDQPARAASCADAKAAWKAAKRAFIDQVRTEAGKLRRRAHAQYRAAKAWG
jgi:hypothetical protein